MVQLEATERVVDLENLIAKHERAIRRYIGRRSGPEVLKRVTVDDVFQEAVASALGSAEGFVFRGDGAFLQWVSTIVRRRIAGYVAGDHRRPHVVRIRGPASSGVGVVEQQLPVRGPTPSSIASGSERRAALAAALAQLPEDYRRVLVLYKLQEACLQEVAASMGRSKGATCRLVARATSALRKMLDSR